MEYAPDLFTTDTYPTSTRSQIHVSGKKERAVSIGAASGGRCPADPRPGPGEYPIPGAGPVPSTVRKKGK